MKYCEDYAALLDLFVDGELPPDEMERVRAHLEACPGCRAYVDDVLAIRAGFPDMEDTVVPENFAGSVMERIRENEGNRAKIVKMKSVRRWTKTLAGLAACCALVILAGTGGWGRSESARMVTGRMNGAAEAPAGVVAGDGADMEAAEDCDAGEESGIEAQAAPEEKAACTMDTAEKERVTVETTGGTGASAESGGTAGGDLLEPRIAAASTAAKNAPDTASDEAANASSFRGAGLYLTAEEAGDLLSGCTIVWEDAGSRGYELSAEEYQVLLAALGRPEDLPEGDGGLCFLVVVTGFSE